MADRLGTFVYLSGTTTATFTFGEDFEVVPRQQSNLQITPLFRSNNAAWNYGRKPKYVDIKQIWRKFSATGTEQSDIETFFKLKREQAMDKSGTLTYQESDGTPGFSEAGWFLTDITVPKVTPSENGTFWVAEYNLTFMKP